MYSPVSTKQEDANFLPLLYTIPQSPTPFTPHPSAFGDSSLTSFDLTPEPHLGQAPVERESPFYSGQYSFQSTLTGTSSVAFDQLRLPLQSNDSADQPSPSPSAPQTRAHIPRPPNAFMLFRSDFLRRGVIPPDVECRQQNLSRIAGQCWNLLSPAEKGQWQQEATRVLAEHQRRNPNYKFSPAPRGSRRTKGKNRSFSEADEGDSEDRIRKIRERYTKLAGPASAPRRRRPRVETHLSGALKYEDVSFRQPAPSPPMSSSPSISSEPDSGLALSSGSPQSQFHYPAPPRRPSTSLGFSTPLFLQDVTSPSGRSLTRPSSAACSTIDLCASLRDLDITPTAATFAVTCAPPKSPRSCSPIIGPHSNPEAQFPEALRDPLPFSTLNMPPTEPASSSMLFLPEPNDLCSNGTESFLSTLYADDSFSLSMTSFSPEEENLFSFDIPFAFDSTTLDMWNLNSPVLEGSLASSL